MFIALYLAAEIILLYYAFLTGSPAMIILGLILLLMFFVMLIMGAISARKASVSLKISDGKLIMGIKKEGILPLNALRFTLSFRYDQSAEGQEVEGKLCFPKGESQAEYPLMIPYAGSGKITVKRLRVSDPLGLFHFPVKNQAAVPVNVFPVREGELLFIPGDREINVFSDYSVSIDAAGNDPSETFQVHEYAPGDSINRIHYKLSAKREQTFVRDFVTESAEFYLLVLDFRKRSQASFHQIVTNTWGLGLSLLAEECPFLLLWADEDAEIYEEQVRNKKDLQDTILYIYQTMHRDHLMEEFSPVDAVFIETEFQEEHQNSVFVRDFIITDESFEELVKRWQNEAE